ncbi:MAG TPA: hypothetical protein VFJ06_14210 [Halococcus sp.]|nr:hypothetical protein [Halococcus sp.]
MSDIQPSTFGCAFCEFEDRPQLLKAHLIEEHAVEIAGQHWGTHIHRVAEEGEP